MLKRLITGVFKALAAFSLMMWVSFGWAQMQDMDDDAMDNVVGQSLFTSNYVAPGASSNPSGTIGFYRITLDAQMDLNMNVNKLALGCGGVNGAGVCDIDIDKLSLTGITSGADAGPPTDFTLYRPFMEFAINNPTSPANREVVGIRFGAQQAWGLMNMGTRPAGSDNNPANHTGVNRFSGDMQAYVDNVKVPVRVCLLFCINSTATIDSNQPNAGNNIFNIRLARASSAVLDASNAVVPCSASYGMCSVALLGIQVGANLTEDMRFIHQIQVGADTNGNGKFDVGEGTNDLSISLQKQNLSWQKISAPTSWNQNNRGWWMSIPKAIMGNTTTAQVTTSIAGIAGLTLNNLDMNQVPVDNCYGALTFC